MFDNISIFFHKFIGSRPTEIEPVVLVHGGAGATSKRRINAKLKGVKKAASCGYDALKRGGSAIDAVEAAIRSFESDPVFNCGIGSALNVQGEVEMDASIMNGKTLASGAVSCVKDVKHTISVARAVMEKTPHTLIVGEGAIKFANEIGAEHAPPGSLVTKEAQAGLEKFIKGGGKVFAPEVEEDDPSTEGGTVGCVAIDAQGNIAAGTSTGGLTGKRAGRCGDTPILGAGTYADNCSGGASATGDGESISRVCLTHTIITGLDQNYGPVTAVRKAIAKLEDRLQQEAGAICLNRFGEVGIAFNAPMMSWAYVRAGEIHYGIWPNEDLKEEYKGSCKS